MFTGERSHFLLCLFFVSVQESTLSWSSALVTCSELVRAAKTWACIIIQAFIGQSGSLYSCPHFHDSPRVSVALPNILTPPSLPHLSRHSLNTSLPPQPSPSILFELWGSLSCRAAVAELSLKFFRVVIQHMDQLWVQTGARDIQSIISAPLPLRCALNETWEAEKD